MPFLPSTTDRVDRGFAAGRSPGACAFEIVIIAIDAAMMLAARAALITPSDSVVYNSLARGGISIWTSDSENDRRTACGTARLIAARRIFTRKTPT
jgi:hypothetical protein